jgi:hypothetical protein
MFPTTLFNMLDNDQILITKFYTFENNLTHKFKKIFLIITELTL